ncbi:MAG: hypothetical protein HUU01_00670, partial [Saprospiraceae bacterium]|nr:hypothetical protein [Saprospiraceae bacterium]
MKPKIIYSAFFSMLLCLVTHQIRAQITTSFTTDSLWRGYSTPDRNEEPLPYNSILTGGTWEAVETSTSLPNSCLDAPLTFPGTPIFSAGNVSCNNSSEEAVFTSFFRKNFTLNGGNNPLCSASITVRADNLFRVYVDGTLVPGPDHQACGGFNYENLSGWNFFQTYTVNIMPYINLSLPTHTLIFEVGNCNYVNYLAASVTINQGYPNVSPAFTVQTYCNNNWSVTATPTTPGGFNHTWELYQTNVQGATTGGTLVATQTGPTANFQWLDLSKFYYIIHRVLVGCTGQSQAVMEVPHFTNANLTYHFEDANGVAKDQFCVGEDIYLDPTGTTNYDRYFMAVKRRPIGSTGPFSDYANYGFTFTNNIGLLNLSYLFKYSGDLPREVFEPGYEYELLFVIQNIPNCIAWIELKKTFTVVCCDGFISPEFKLTLHTGEQGQEITVSDFEPYTNAPVTNTWIILSSPNQNGGPYTLVQETTTTGAGPITLMTQGEPGLFHFVIHRLSTSCGDFCFGRYGIVGGFGFGAIEEECDLCGPIDCSILDNLCLVPDHETAACTSLAYNGVNFTWNPAQGATQYRVQIILNDNACCHTGPQALPLTYTVINNSMTLGGLSRSCFSWRIGAVCGGQTFWTEYHCFRGCDETDGGGTGFG